MLINDFFTFLLNDKRELLPLSFSRNRLHDLAQVIFGAKFDRTVGVKGIRRFDDDRVFTLCKSEIGRNNVLKADGSPPVRNLNTMVKHDWWCSDFIDK